MREREIAGLLRDKHPDGMQQLLLHYGPLIRYIIAPIVPDAHDREDCFSEVTLRTWEKADRFAPPSAAAGRHGSPPSRGTRPITSRGRPRAAARVSFRSMRPPLPRIQRKRSYGRSGDGRCSGRSRS